MTKKELISEIAERANVPSTTTTKIFDATIDVVIDEILKGGVRIDGLGTFKKVSRKARTAKNPRTGEIVTVPERNAVSFKTSTALEDKIR